MIRFCVLILAVITTASLGNSKKLNRSPRIHKGYVANVIDFPYVAAFEVAGTGTCGATIIRKDVVLTASHCIGSNHARTMTVRAGTPIREDQRGRNMQWRKVKRVKTHPDHKVGAYGNNDIAVVWLEKPFKFNEFVNRIDLADRLYNGYEATVLGWGMDENFKDSKRLKRGVVEVISNQECSRKSPQQFKITDNMICSLGVKTQQTICKGDSGGPIVLHDPENPSNDQLIGVTSYGRVVEQFGKKFCNPDLPVVYTSIAKLRNWILCDQLKEC